MSNMASKVSCAPWQDLLLGSATTSSATYDECAPDTVVISTNAVTASGATSDNQEIVYQELCGDGQLIAKVSGLSGGYAGLFVRESNATGARKGAIMTQKGSTVFRHLRSTTDGLQLQASYMASGHQWLKINRSGTQVIGSWSTNGTSWNVAFNTALSMTDCVVIGMAAFSTSSGTTINATFTNVSVAQSDTIPSTEVAFADSSLTAQGGDTVEICVNLQNPCYCSPVTVDVALATDSLPHLIGFEPQTLTFEEGDTVQCFTVVLAESDTNGTYTFELTNLEGGNESEIGAIGELVLEVEANEEEEEEAPAFGVCGKFYKAPPEITDSSALLFSDRFGNIYLAEELVLPESPLEACGCDEFTDIPHYEENYFELHFQDCIADLDTGFNDNVLGAERRRAACKAFAYLSHLIQRNANPCDEEAELPNIQVHIKTMPTSNSKPLAGATPVYEFSYYISNGGIIDGLPWKIINNPGYSNQSNEIYHGIVEVNFNNNYHLGDTSDVPGNQFDLYTVMLHEGLHILGFASAIKILDGDYLFAGAKSYTRYDTHLELEDETPVVIRHGTDPYRWILNPAIDVETDLHASCTADPGPTMEFVSFYDMLRFPIYTGDYTTGQDVSANQGSSFSHLNNSCAGAFAPYLMDPFIPIGERLDLIEEGEKRILCDLGYRVLEMENCSCSVAGNHDPVVACSEELFVFTLCEEDSTEFIIDLEDLLGNDIGVTNVAYLDIPGFGTLVELVNNNDGTISFITCSPGEYSFIYTPVSDVCPQEGSPVRVRVRIERCDDCNFFSTGEAIPKALECNLICNPHVVGLDCATGLVSETSVIDINCSAPIDLPGWIGATTTPDFQGLDGVSPNSGSLSVIAFYNDNEESFYTPLSLVEGNYFFSFYTRGRNHISSSNAFEYRSHAALVNQDVIEQFGACYARPEDVSSISLDPENHLDIYSGDFDAPLTYLRGVTCFEVPDSNNFSGLWIWPEITAQGAGSSAKRIYYDEFELIPDNFTAGQDRDFYECDTLLALGGTDFCMLSNMRIRYTWKTLTDSVLLEYDTRIDSTGALTVWVDEEASDTIPELRVLPTETTTYILMREIVSEGFEDFAECFAAQDSVTVTFIETFPYELSVYDTSACGLVRGFEVTGGDGPFAWDFGDGQSTTTTSGQINHLYTNAGTYTVTVTLPEHPGCSLTDTVNVSATVFTGNFSYSIGECGEVDFLATDAHANNYFNLWTFGDGGGPDSLLGSHTYTYSTADTFVVVHTIYNECGEPFTAVDTLIIPPFLPEVEASVTLDSTTCNGFSFEAAGNADTLTWFFPGDSIYVGDSTTFEFDEPGIYEVVLEAANECGTVSTVLTVVATSCEAIDCCPDGAVVLAGNLLLSDVIEAELLNPGSTSENICIQGILTIDTNYVFSSDTITLDAGSSIVIQSGSNLSINLALLQGCEFLWDNILVQDGASLMVRSSIFRDATNAIEARNGSNIVVTGSTFENNFTGILVPGVDTGQIVIHSIVNNDFIFTAQHLKPLLTIFGPLPVFPISFSGIEVNNVTNFTVSGPSAAGPSDDPVNAASTNRFKGLYCGIRAFNSNLIVHGAQFEDIVQIPFAGFSLISAGILFEGGNSSTLLQTGYGDQPFFGNPPGSQIATPSFINCTSGIEVTRGHARISDNRMLDMETGIRITRAIDREIAVRDNYIEANWEGITAAINSPSLDTFSFTIEENRIKIGTDSTSGNAGISINEGIEFEPHSLAKVQNNEVEGRARNGIFVQNVEKWRILENAVINTDALGNGIHVLGSSNSTFQCNRIGTDDGDNGRRGLNVENSTELLIDCNTSYGFETGIRFAGTSTSTTLRGNEMSENNIGLHLDLAIFNKQVHRGNKWIGSFGSNGARFDFMDFNDVQVAQFFVDTTDGDFLMPPNPVPADDWFIPESGNTYFCPENENACISGLTPDFVPGETDVLVANGGILHPVLRWIAEKDLYRKMQKDSGFGAGINLYNNFESSKVNTPVGKFYALYRDMEVAFVADSLQQALYRTGQEDVWNLLDSMGAITTNLLTATGMDSAALVVIRDNLFTNIATKAVILDSLYALVLVNRSAIADTLLLQNAAITVQKLYESNEKAVADIFLSVILKEVGSFSSTQEKTLQAIASQCPWVGGDAVYTARSLYRLIEPKSVFDDDVLCGRNSPPETLRREESLPEALAELKKQPDQSFWENLEVSVYPNPARDVIHIAFSDQPKGVVETRLFTLQGKPVDRRTFGVANSNFSLSTQHLPSGMYFLQIRIDEQIITTTRIAIIR